MGNIVVELVKVKYKCFKFSQFFKTSRPTLANLKSVKQKWLIL